MLDMEDRAINPEDWSTVFVRFDINVDIVGMLSRKRPMDHLGPG